MTIWPDLIIMLSFAGALGLLLLRPHRRAERTASTQAHAPMGRRIDDLDRAVEGMGTEEGMTE